jgi:Dipeptidyl aminopeptidases/acylaminoacyl-peptidases
MKMKRLGILALALLLILTMSGCEDLQRLLLNNQPSATATGSETSAQPTASLPSATDELIPLEVLMDYPSYTAPQISSDGSLLLYRYMTDTNDVVMVKNWQTGDTTMVPWPAYGIPYFTWAPDGKTILFFIDDMGDENHGLYTTDIETGETRTILLNGENNCYYAADIEGRDDEIILAVLNYGSESYDLYRVNYITGNMDLIFTNPGNISGFNFDSTGALRLVTVTGEDASVHVLLKTNAAKKGTSFVESDWKEIFNWDYEDAGTSSVYGFMPDNEQILYVDSSVHNTSTLRCYNTKTGVSTDIFNDPGYDLYGTWTDLELDKVTAVTTYSQYIEWHVLDDSFQDDYDALSAIGQSFDVYNSSENDAYWLVEYVSDTSEPDYYLYEMATHETTFLFNAQPDLLDYDLYEMAPFAYTAGDGLDIEGYVTFPAGAAQDLPAVVLVHGGPWLRDTWEYNYEVQFLANRGYLVIQVNYRGSTGYGRDFMLAGDKEWGRAMHQDILDAVDYAVDQGWADPARIGVYGASYGGYEALVCAAFSSGVFQCSVDAFGPSSLLTFMDMSSLPTQWATEYQDLIRSVGDPETEADDMRSRSPLYYADQVTIPVLIVQGENDVRVPQSESEQMVEALEDAGADVQYILFPNIGHGFSSPEVRTEFYTAMEDFFAKHLGGRAESQE